jgi:hypothetical protein
MTKLTDMEFTNTLTDLNMKVIGKTISNMEKDRSSGMMAVSLLASMSTLKKKERDNIFGLMVISILETGVTTKLMVKVSIFGLMEDAIQEIGKIT